MGQQKEKKYARTCQADKEQNKMEDPMAKLNKLLQLHNIINMVRHTKFRPGSPVENFDSPNVVAKHRGLWSL